MTEAANQTAGDRDGPEDFSVAPRPDEAVLAPSTEAASQLAAAPAKDRETDAIGLTSNQPITGPTAARVLDQAAYDLFRPILAQTDDGAPDARPLYAYALSAEEFAAVEAYLSGAIRRADPTIAAGAAFVFWAAEHIRARFPSGDTRHLSWAFVFSHFGLPEDGALARRLTRLGMSFWLRPTRKAIDGSQLYLYSLMAEGGLPEALLREEGLYQRVVLKLLDDIEAAGGPGCSVNLAEEIAKQAVSALPPIFHDDYLISLLAAFGVGLARLRSKLPPNVPRENIQRWLDEREPDWARTLPLRASAETLNGLIVPALQIERAAQMVPAPGMALAARELRLGVEGGFRAFVRFAEEAWITQALLPPETQGLRLRLVPNGALAASGGLFFFAEPESNGWRARRANRGRVSVAPVGLSQSVSFTALADGRPLGEIVVDAGLPDSQDAITLWRPADDGSEDVLALSPTGRVRASCLYALGPADTRPEASAGLSLSVEPCPAEGQVLWRVSGKGTLVFSDVRLKIETSAESDALEARLTAFGETLVGWKTRPGDLVFLGRPDLCGQRGDGALERLPPLRLKTRPTRGRVLWEHVAEWVEDGITLARRRYIFLPQQTRIAAHETGEGKARLRIEGLGAAALRVTARASDATGETGLVAGAGEIVLKIQGAPPGEIELTLADPTTGTALTLVTPWPARRGMMLHVDGRRLSEHTGIAVEELCQWRAVAPGAGCDLIIQFSNRKIILPFAGETPLGILTSLVSAILAQGELGAQTNIWVRSGGLDGFRLETRRYADFAAIRNGVLYTSLPRDVPPADTAFADALAPRRIAKLQAVDLRSGAALRLESETPCDLGAMLGVDGGPWLVAPRLDGRPQRPVVFNPRLVIAEETADAPVLEGRQTVPITSKSIGPPTGRWVTKWNALAQTPDDPEWTRLCGVVEALVEGDGAGATSQIQALADVPQAAIMLALRVRLASLEKILDLDKLVPMLFPALRVEHYSAVVAREYAVAAADAGDRLFTRIRHILLLRTELSTHFGRALADAGLAARVFNDQKHTLLRDLLTRGDPLETLAQEVARRANHVPEGLTCPRPCVVQITHALNSNATTAFNTHTRKLVDAPIVVAEMAAGLRTPPTRAEMISLIGLRFIDSLYFDAAVPVALKLALEKK